MIAALFVEKNGVYQRLLGPDLCWHAERDARLYPGPFPIVAHPPCERWGRYAPRYGGIGQDEFTFQSALASLKLWGGVLEHPSGSLAWGHYAIRAPKAGQGWIEAGAAHPGLLTCSVEQGHYGHRARKPTWLLYSGSTRPPELIWGKSEAQIKPRPGRDPIKERRTGACQRMCRQERRRTPEPFAVLLIGLAGASRG